MHALIMPGFLLLVLGLGMAVHDMQSRHFGSQDEAE